MCGKSHAPVPLSLPLSTRIPESVCGLYGNSSTVQNAFAPSPFMSVLPPGMLMWAGMYTALFYVCSGMIAALYDPE